MWYSYTFGCLETYINGECVGMTCDWRDSDMACHHHLGFAMAASDVQWKGLI